jgi:thioredoxin 1
MALEITDSNFEAIVSSDKPVLIDFWAEWCAPCVAISPLIEELAERHKDTIIIGKMNVDSNPMTQIKFNIRSIPTFIIFKDGVMIEKFVGAQPKTFFEDKIALHTSKKA